MAETAADATTHTAGDDPSRRDFIHIAAIAAAAGGGVAAIWPFVGQMNPSADTLALVRARNPGVDFVWIMGADSLRDFHRWQRWRQIMLTFPVAVIDRPGATLSFLSSVAAKTFDYARIDERDAPLLARLEAPAWTFIHGPRSSLSSTALRAAQAG